MYSNLAGKVVIPDDWYRIGQHFQNGSEILGATTNGGTNHWVNIARMTIADKLKVIGGGYKHVLKGTSIWGPIKGHVTGPKSFLKIYDFIKMMICLIS